MPFAEDEVTHYRQLAAMILNNDKLKKERLDKFARLQLATVRSVLPGADDDIVVTFLVSVAIMVARVLAAPVADAAELGHQVFDQNMIAAAHVMGAYNIDSSDIPLWKEPKPEPEPGDSGTGMYL
jgi:hypothetical protein